MIPDILQTDLGWRGQDVYIVGPGPNAEPHMLKPGDLVSSHPGKHVIACNKGLYYKTMPTVWLCATAALAQCNWFNKQMRMYNTMPTELAAASKPLIVGRQGEWLNNYPFTHFFNPGGSLWSHVKRHPITNKVISVYKGFGCSKGYLRGGASAVARGVQLAWFNGAKRCILIGADMKGAEYYDGTINEWKHTTMDKDKNWVELTYFNELIKWVKEHNMDVVSLTKTELDVEVI